MKAIKDLLLVEAPAKKQNTKFTFERWSQSLLFKPVSLSRDVAFLLCKKVPFWSHSDLSLSGAVPPEMCRSFSFSSPKKLKNIKIYSGRRQKRKKNVIMNWKCV